MFYFIGRVFILFASWKHEYGNGLSLWNLYIWFGSNRKINLFSRRSSWSVVFCLILVRKNDEKKSFCHGYFLAIYAKIHRIHQMTVPILLLCEHVLFLKYSTNSFYFFCNNSILLYSYISFFSNALNSKHKKSFCITWHILKTNLQSKWFTWQY